MVADPSRVAAFPPHAVAFSTPVVARRTVDLINTLSEPEPGAGDRVDAVTDVLRRHGETGPLRISPDDVDAMAAVARALRKVFMAGGLETAAERLNDLLRTTPSPPRLTSHGGATTWHLHLDRDDEGPWGEWFLTSASLALAALLTERQSPPGGVCAARDCRRVYLSHGRGGVRRFCSPRCATRERVAAHRESKRRA